MNKTEIDKKDVSAVPVNVLAVMESAALLAYQHPPAGEAREGWVLVTKELVREAADNAKASIVESGISDQRREYRVNLAERLRQAIEQK